MLTPATENPNTTVTMLCGGFIPQPLSPLTGILVSLTRYIPQCWGLNSSCRLQVLLVYADDFSSTVTKYPGLAHGDGGSATSRPL